MRVLRWSSAILIISILLAALCWRWFGYDYHVGSGFILDINFFATVCNWFTVIGLGLTVFQVSKLENDHLIRAQAIREIRQQDFKARSLEKCGYIKRVLESLHDRIETDITISRATVNDYGTEIHLARSYLQAILQAQESVTGNPLVDGRKALTLLYSIEEELTMMSDALIINFPRNRQQFHIHKALLEIESCISQLNT